MEYDIEINAKKWLIIGAVGGLILIMIFIFFKFFVTAPPKPKLSLLPEGITETSPEGVAIRYLWAEQEGEKDEAKEYLFPDLSRVEVFRENYFSISRPIWIPQKKVGSPPTFQLLDSQIKGNKANVIIKEITNRRKGDIFWGFALPPVVIFQFNLVKVENQWKINKIDLPNFISESKIGEKTNIDEKIFAKLITIGELPANIKIEPSELFTKFLFIKVKYENQSENEINFEPYREWRIFNEEGAFSSPIFNSVFKTAGALPPQLKLTANSAKEGYLFFEVPEDFSIKEVRFKNLYKKIIFKI